MLQTCNFQQTDLHKLNVHVTASMKKGR